MKFVLYGFGLLLSLAGLTVVWLNNVPVVRVLEVYKVAAEKPFEVTPNEAVNLFYVPAEAVVNGKIRLVRAGHVVEVTIAEMPTAEELAAKPPEGKVTVLAPMQDRELAIIPPYGDIAVGAQVRGERLGSGY